MFITSDIDILIREYVVNRTFPNLISQQQEMLHKYIYGIVQMIATSFDFYSDKNNFIKKIKQNSFEDLRWLLTYLLPYINQNVKKMSEIQDLNDLYTLRYDLTNNNNSNIEDINFVSPKYVYSNIQYGRSIRDNIGTNGSKSLKFNESHIEQNYYLLLNTILTMRNKLYINWIDVLPFRMDNYKSSSLYKNTYNTIKDCNLHIFDVVIDYPIKKAKSRETIDRMNLLLKGMNIEDIYNTISLDLYESIVKYKWMIFDIDVTINSQIKIIPLLHILDSIFDTNVIKNNVDWDLLTNNDIDNFKSKWQRLLFAFERENGIDTNKMIISSDAIKTVVKSFIVYFDRKYSKIDGLESYARLTRSNVYDDIDDYDERMQDVTDDMVLKSAKTININYVYDFLKECYEGIYQTWYGNILSINFEDETKSHLQSVLFPLNATTSKVILTLKNIYNFCKSLVHERKIKDKRIKDRFSNEYVRLGMMWNELDNEKQEIVLSRLNNKTTDWFNISRNLFFILMKIHPEMSRQELNRKIGNEMSNIYNNIRENLTDLLFEANIMKGTLSYMVAETELTDAKVYDISIPEKKRNLVETISKKRFYKDNPYGDNSYYYLTGRKYGKTGTYYAKITDKPDYFDYFKICSTIKTAWYVATTYHWIAQIGFCHRFINNRVNYITGGTGAGKSTQVPKMFMYYLKAIDRIPNPTVIITVPRTNVATGVSNFVSQELAVPLKVINIDTQNEEISKTNKYIQYKHMKDNNVDDGSYPKIRYITDGSVLMDAKDPFLKRKRINNNNVIYSRNNKYDVVIIDEAHEHNANMDMIISLMRNPTYYNNKLRLVIMSATMDADEPTYRQFYRDVNDNLKFPLNNWIKKHKLDRINTERRFHISSPDATTRFKIDEIYRPGEDANDIAREIINTSSSGDILLFRPGTTDIANTIEILNAEGVLPDNVIALPYHAQLSDDVKNFIGSIDKRLKDLRIDKTYYITDLSKATTDDLTFGNNYYTRCILVATNIAEASISIETLRFVIDTGLEKTMRYDSVRRTNILTTNYITDASRLQRKGRVGRVAPGTVYYTYREGELKNNVKQFNISVQDIHQTILLELIRDPNDKPIITDILNDIASGHNLKNKLINHFENYSRIIKLKKNNDDEFILSKENILRLITADYKNKNFNNMNYIDSIIDIIGDNYICNDTIYDYYGNDSYYDYHNSVIPYKIYNSGFDSDQIVDSIGNFYIVHPDELSINRNVNGYIIGSKNNFVKILELPNNNVRHRMVSNKIIVFWEILINGGFVGIKDSKIIYRTKLGDILRIFSSNFSMFNDVSLIKMLYYGYGLSNNDIEFDRILILVSALNIIGQDSFIKKLIYFEPIQKQYQDQGKSLSSYKKNMLMNDLISNIKKTLNKNNVFDSDIDVLDIFDIIDKYPSSLHLLQTNTNINVELIKNILRNKEELKSLCNMIIVSNPEIKKLREYINGYRHIMDINKIDLFKGVIMLSKPYSIKRKVENTSDTYISVYNPDPDTILQLPKDSTFTDPRFYQEYILNLSENLEYKTLSNIISLNISDLILLGNVYNKLVVNKIKHMQIDSNTKKNVIDKYYNDSYPNNIPINSFLNYSTPEYINSISNTNKTIQKIATDINNINSDVMFNVLKNIDIDSSSYINVLSRH